VGELGGLSRLGLGCLRGLGFSIVFRLVIGGLCISFRTGGLCDYIKV
jgi:hypothetical protein